MHITYDLPVTIEDIQDARKRLAGKIGNDCRARIISANGVRAKYSLSLRTCSVPVRSKFAARLIN